MSDSDEIEQLPVNSAGSGSGAAQRDCMGPNDARFSGEAERG